MGNYSTKENGIDNGTGQPSMSPRSMTPRREYGDDRGVAQESSLRSFPTYNIENQETDDIIPTVFKWDHGGKNVYITGTFNNWEKQLPMHRSGNEFSYVYNVKRGKHAYKFIVDDEWRHAPDQPTIADVEGRINNFIDVSEFTPYIGDDHFFEKSKDQKVADSEFQQYFPDIDEYTKEPPALPPHLRHIILNKQSPTVDPLALPVPQQVSLNHLYCTAIKDGMMVLGSTQRYKEKYCTIVLYSVMPSPAAPQV
jgi:5'-AMP-activated protein kinase, regulatory beta subunit